MNEFKEFKENLKNPNIYYLNKKERITTQDTQSLDLSDVVLYRVHSISFVKDAPRREALENVLSALRIEGINFIYLILGDENEVEFYYGISRDYSKNPPKLDVDEIGKFILEPSIKGNFRGSNIEAVSKEEKRLILEKIQNNSFQSIIEGVPGVLEKESEFQGMDRFADVMGVGSEFGFMIIASLLSDNDLLSIEKNIFELYSGLLPLAKHSFQSSLGENESKTQGSSKTSTKSTNDGESRSEITTKGESKSWSKNESETEGTNESKTKQTTRGKSESEGSSYSTSESGSESKATGSSDSKTTGSSESVTHNQSKQQSLSKNTGTSESLAIAETSSTQTGTTKSDSITKENLDKQIQDWLKYIDDVLLPRIDYGKGKGMFLSSMFCFSNSKAVLMKLENTIISLFSGESGNKLPLRAFLLDDGKRLKAFRNLQLPKISLQNADKKLASLLSQSPVNLGNVISSKELSLIAGLPKKDVVGLELKEEVEFGLNFKEASDPLVLGKLIQSGNVTNKSVSIDSKNLDKHIFITGVTGSGKTTTCQNILINSNKPFLVIEPAKTEYRILKNKYEDLLIFTLGKDTLAPFRLNPFEFFPHESISSRVDMIKASIEAAFDMEAAIPQIIESAIYECYKDKGWNIATNENEIYGKDAFNEGVYSFPTLEDLHFKVQSVVKEQGFDERLKNDYIGSIKARLNGLLVGAKGFMLNTKRSVDFRKLLDRRIVLEMEEIRNGSEKSLIMGFILGNALEAIKANFLQSEKKHGVKHIILIEEAHRLLSKFQPGDSPNKKQGVEVFADMLAEIRKYGECLMIADQIPSKLTPEVLKNTNTKIVHRIFAADDQEALRNTMALEREQAEFLSKLEVGAGVVFSGGFNKAVMTKMKQELNTSSDEELISEELIQKSAYEFYLSEYKSGVLMGSHLLESPNLKDIENLFALQRRGLMKALKENYTKTQKVAPKLLQSLKEFEAKFDKNFLAKYLILENKLDSDAKKEEDKNKIAKIAFEFIDKYLNEKLDIDDVQYFKDNLF
ncbi:ATP-binding protein [Campylobacter sp. MIT 99-7217]|uniref:ATP-binding protein n=1 Tax=Campylobacter sp. MIT 99-7217 TaxID=535091 RepID=UPI0011571E43|nr:ATP-binding protein [Campylobacter sp. MIT 99-7217]TQR33136.1 ATP-binding protein [Campylobacter sp. MIT 99-7217]